MSSRPAAMEVLRQEHANMTLLLDLFECQVAALRQQEDADFVLIGGIVDYFLTYPDLMHHPKEDILFHRLRELDPAAAAKAEGTRFIGPESRPGDGGSSPAGDGRIPTLALQSRPGLHRQEPSPYGRRRAGFLSRRT